MLKTNKKLIEKIILNQNKIYGGAISPSWDIIKQVEENYSEKVAERDWKEISKYIQIDKKMKILDLGCGYGYFVAFLKSKGYLSFGCDTDIYSVTIAKQLLKENGFDSRIVKNNNENILPYPSESFDFINLNYVLVYTKDWTALFGEIKRILKKDGQVYLITPNYQCCYDVNYGLFLFYWLPRSLNTLYLRAMGRKNVNFFSTFNFTTKNNLEKVFKMHNFLFEDVGIKKWYASIAKLNFTGRSELYKKIFTAVRKFHLERVLSLFAKLGFYTPLVYLLKKND